MGFFHGTCVELVMIASRLERSNCHKTFAVYPARVFLFVFEINSTMSHVVNPADPPIAAARALRISMFHGPSMG